jgi:hypothetical protein
MEKCIKVTKSVKRIARHNVEIKEAVCNLWDALGKCDYSIAALLLKYLKAKKCRAILNKKAGEDSYCPTQDCPPPFAELPPVIDPATYERTKLSHTLDIWVKAGSVIFCRMGGPGLLSLCAPQWNALYAYFEELIRKLDSTTDVVCISLGTGGGLSMDRDGVMLVQNEQRLQMTRDEFKCLNQMAAGIALRVNASTVVRPAGRGF